MGGDNVAYTLAFPEWLTLGENAYNHDHMRSKSRELVIQGSHEEEFYESHGGYMPTSVMLSCTGAATDVGGTTLPFETAASCDESNIGTAATSANHMAYSLPAARCKGSSTCKFVQIPDGVQRAFCTSQAINHVIHDVPILFVCFSELCAELIGAQLQ